MDFLCDWYVPGTLQDYCLEDNEPLSIPAVLPDVGDLCGRHLYESPPYLPSSSVVLLQSQDHKVLPPRLPSESIHDPSVYMAAIFCMNPVSVDCLHTTVLRRWLVPREFPFGRVTISDWLVSASDPLFILGILSFFRVFPLLPSCLIPPLTPPTGLYSASPAFLSISLSNFLFSHQITDILPTDKEVVVSFVISFPSRLFVFFVSDFLFPSLSSNFWVTVVFFSFLFEEVSNFLFNILFYFLDISFLWKVSFWYLPLQYLLLVAGFKESKYSFVGGSLFLFRLITSSGDFWGNFAYIGTVPLSLEYDWVL